MPSSPAELLIRRLLPGDAAAIQRVASSLRRYFSPHDLAEIAALLRERPSGWVAVGADGELVGFLLDTPADDPDVRELAWMGVSTPWQGQGLGTRLLQALIDTASAAGVQALEVSTVAESANYAPYAETRAFYHRRGFVDVRIDLDYYWPGGDRLVLRRKLRST